MHKCISVWSDVYISVTASIGALEKKQDERVHFLFPRVLAVCQLSSTSRDAVSFSPTVLHHDSALYSSLTLTMRYGHDYGEWHKCVWTRSAMCGGCSNLTISCVFIWFCFSNVIIMGLDVLLGLKTEWEFGEKWISNIKERECRGREKKPSAQKVGHRSRHVRGCSREISLIQ